MTLDSIFVGIWFISIVLGLLNSPISFFGYGIVSGWFVGKYIAGQLVGG